MLAGAPGATTYLWGWWPALMLRIDHVFVTPSWCATDPRTFTAAGSDHLGVDVAVGPAPERAGATRPSRRAALEHGVIPAGSA